MNRQPSLFTVSPSSSGVASSGMRLALGPGSLTILVHWLAVRSTSTGSKPSTTMYRPMVLPLRVVVVARLVQKPVMVEGEVRVGLLRTTKLT